MKNKRGKIWGGLAGLLVVVIALLFIPPQSSPPKEDLRRLTFAVLGKARQAKKKALLAHFRQMEQQAATIGTDSEMLAYFERLQGKTGDADLEYEVDKRYVMEYGDFYDLLFVDAKGHVFHSVKKEQDYRKNLFSPALADSRLAKALKNPDDEQFVEFRYYPPSGEPAAFFTVVARQGGRHLGWFVLQVATNRVNTIFNDRQGLGRSGEVYLVNQERLMLTDSRFMEDSTILRQQVDTWAVKDALRHESGENIILDYRGAKVFSSYEKVEALGVPWVIIAEMDEDEVITEYYKRHRHYFQRELVRYLAKPRLGNGGLLNRQGGAKRRVDMNEFARTETGRSLTTGGVATCTAVAISYPGRFGYLAHISPTDEIYLGNPLTRTLLGDEYHNFLADLLEKIKRFDIYPYELNRLQVVVVATHADSFCKAVEALLAEEVELAQIKFLYNPRARSATLELDDQGETLAVQWVEPGGDRGEQATDVEDLGAILKKIIRYGA